MEKFELNETHLKLYKNKNNNLKKLKFKDVSKGFIYSENGQYAGCVAVDSYNRIIYFEIMETFYKYNDSEKIINDSVNLLNATEVSVPINDIKDILSFQHKGFKIDKTTKKEVTLKKITPIP